jgi:hypothetical protein
MVTYADFGIDLPLGATGERRMTCPRCGAIDAPALGLGTGSHTASTRGRHRGRFLKWLATRPPGKRQARRQQGRQQAMTARPPSAAPLVYLVVLGDVGPVPSTMVEAPASIHALVRGKGQS